MSKKDQRSKGFSGAAELIHKLLKRDSSPLSQQFLRWKLWNNWEEVVGPSIGKNTAPCGYYKGVLYVWVKSSTWLQEMSFMEHAMKEKVNKFLGEKWCYKIRFTLDRKSVPSSAENAQEMRDFLSK
jgi:predicted nucleic acid-binding Zn ribbon protein